MSTSRAFGDLAFATLLVGALGCGTNSPVTLENLGMACDDNHPCSGGAECGTCGIGTGQCVAPCSASGSAGCPTGSFCSLGWAGATEHVCVRTCNADLDCRTPTSNTGLSCNDPIFDPGTHVDDVAICNVSNSIGSTHTCP
ncbi:MAG: hypothetical protein ABJE66_17125 [Deltaproteobacteria bacterium]